MVASMQPEFVVAADAGNPAALDPAFPNMGADGGA
jgi:hypothetical protein